MAARIMWNLFKTWRRKIGVFTLLLACLFAVGWVRSLSLKDEITIGISQATFVHSLGTVPHGIEYSKGELQLPADLPWRFSTRPVEPSDFAPTLSLFLGTIKFHYRFLGVEVGSCVFDNLGQTTWQFIVVPYWSIVVPMTMISFWLLLSSHRQNRSGSAVESK